MAAPVLIAGEWVEADASASFHAIDPRTTEPMPEAYPVSNWADLDAMLDAAVGAYRVMRLLPPETLAAYLDLYASKIEANAQTLAGVADHETALGKQDRFIEIEIPRTIEQLHQAAAAARDGSWAKPTIDTATNLRSMLRPLGVVCVFGPSNFPFAYHGIAGGDFASAIAAGNPVIAKGHPSHPKTSQMLAGLALQAIHETVGMPEAAVQLFYDASPEDGLKLIADPRNAALGFTGSRPAGLALKKACDTNGKPAYLEMSSINPVVLLPGALEQRLNQIVKQFVDSVLLGSGQFCTNPGLVLGLKGHGIDTFLANAAEQFDARPGGTLLNKASLVNIVKHIDAAKAAGATCITVGSAGEGFSIPNTLLTVDGTTLLEDPHTLQTEAFGNSSLVVIADDIDQLLAVVRSLKGSLTGSIYSAADGGDDEAYASIEPDLSDRVGRLLNDKMPTGVAVVSAQNHGGPFPATGHPGFTAVGFPAALQRFAKLTCYDHVRPDRLPDALKDANPTGIWRLIDGLYTQAETKAAS